MPPFRDEVVLVIASGSQTTRVQYGLAESLLPAQLHYKTRVYKSGVEGGRQQYALSGNEEDAIYPMVKGKIIDLDALTYLYETIYKLNTSYAEGLGPVSPILLTCNAEWRPNEIEYIIAHLFREIHVPAIAFVPEALGASFAFAAPNACVVNIGAEKTEIIPVIDFAIQGIAETIVDIGGNWINDDLAKLLPSLDKNQIEELKTSEIYEVLHEHTQDFFGEPSDLPTTSLEEEGIVDVAAIISSDNAREALAQREQKKNSKQVELKNSELARNSFTDSKGRRVEVGTERFKGSERLIEALTHEIGRTISKLEDIPRRGDCWENIILVGGTTAIKGFNEAMLRALQERFLIARASTFSEVPSGFNTPGYATPPLTPAIYGHSIGHGQVPTSIKISKMAEYFIGWKGHTWEDAQFLGSQIAAKQIFTPGIASIDGAYLSQEEFLEKGAKEIWNLGLF
ncbi:uncharacterized protein V1516DRAFT_670166 [Lipomyces oligophaga]|uniref:uncharacterized protein n=1 Tax=Lipomyces oligophaga TaxID=45792 RepID=UPI0034D01C08